MSIPSVHLLERLKLSEGFRAQPYVCPAGRATIGYGHNLEAHPAAILPYDRELAGRVAAGEVQGAELVKQLHALGMVWNRRHAEERLAVDMLSVMDGLASRCPAYRHLVNLAASAHAGKSEGPSPLSSVSEGADDSATESEETGRMDLSDARRAEVRAEVLIDMAFNMGVAGLLGFRNTLGCVRRDDYDGAASGMLQSRWASQVKGRAVELARQMRTGKRSESPASHGQGAA